MQEIIKLEEVCKKYSGKSVLDTISFSVIQGQIFGLLGPSGAGKTTLIKILTTQIEKDSGFIRVMQCDIEHWDSSLNREIGIMTDNCGLYERLTCYENLKLYCGLYGKPPFIIGSLLEQVGLTEARNKVVSELSKGMRQRLSLVRAMINFPGLLFLDEPTSDLDPNTTLQIHELIQELKKQGTTIFLTTHDMSEASKLCDTIGLLHHGQIIEFGNPDELCLKYNLEDNIYLIDKNNNQVILANGPESATLLYDYFINNNVKSIKTSEINLEQLFIRLTGKGIDDEENHYKYKKNQSDI